jgi:MFS family permease
MQSPDAHNHDRKLDHGDSDKNHVTSEVREPARDASGTVADDPSLSRHVDGDAEKTAHKANAAASTKTALDTTEPTEKTSQDDQDEDEDEDESHYPSGPKLWLLTFGLCLTTFVIALDNTIIATAIPKITTVFNSLGDVGWYGSAYALTTCSLQPTFGKIYTYFDVKYTYLFALLLFEAGSIVCAAATSSPMFIVGRAVAGAGAAALFSGGMTIIGFSVPLRRRAIYIAALGSMFGIASVVGPILGGAFTDRLSWRWCFWINLPFGGVSLAVVFFFFANPERKYSHVPVRERLKEIDVVGALFLICAVVSLLLALQWGGFTYAWGDSRVWGTLLAFGLLIAVFIGLQVYQKDRATIPFRVFRQRTIWVSCVFSALLSMALYTYVLFYTPSKSLPPLTPHSHIFYLPFYFQAIKGTTAEESGIRTIAYLISSTLGSLAVGSLITLLGTYAPFMWLGSALFAIGSGLLYTLTVSSPPRAWIGYQVLAGLGSGAGVQIPFIAVQVVASPRDMPTANACVLFFNSLGGALSISIAQNIFVNTLAREVPRRAPGVDAQAVASAGATNLRAVVDPRVLPGVLDAYNQAVVTAFVLAIAAAGAAFVVSLRMERRSVKGVKIVAGGGA